MPLVYKLENPSFSSRCGVQAFQEPNPGDRDLSCIVAAAAPSPCLPLVLPPRPRTIQNRPALLTCRKQGEDLKTAIPPTAPDDRITRLREAISQPVVAAFWAGGVAGAVSRTVVSPLERLKILFQVQSAGRDAYQLSVGKALGKMWREEGWRGFMRGNGTNCIRIVPYSAVQFGSYNFYKRVCYQIFLFDAESSPRAARSGMRETHVLTLETRISSRNTQERT